jgi:hypothetical protein
VTPNTGIPLSQLNIDETKYTKKSGGDRPEDVYYVNEERGEVLRVFNGTVVDMSYGPTAIEDKGLKCKRLSNNRKLSRNTH